MTTASIGVTWVTTRYGVYRNAGGLILARLADKRSCYFQPGDDAAAFEREIEEAELRAWRTNPVGLNDDLNRVFSAYDEVMVADGGGAPTTHGSQWVWL